MRYKRKYGYTGKNKSSNSFNRKTGMYYGRGIISGKRKRLETKGRYLKKEWHDKSIGYKRKKYYSRSWT